MALIRTVQPGSLLDLHSPVCFGGQANEKQGSVTNHPVHFGCLPCVVILTVPLCIPVYFCVHVCEVPVIPVSKLVIPSRCPLAPCHMCVGTHASTHTQLVQSGHPCVRNAVPQGGISVISHRAGSVLPEGRMETLAGNTYRLKKRGQRQEKN